MTGRVDLDASGRLVAIAAKALACGRQLGKLSDVFKQSEQARQRANWHGLAQGASKCGEEAMALGGELAAVPAGQASSRTTLRPCLETYVDVLGQAASSLGRQFEALGGERQQPRDTELDGWFRTAGIRRLDIAGIALESALWPPADGPSAGSGSGSPVELAQRAADLARRLEALSELYLMSGGAALGAVIRSGVAEDHGMSMIMAAQLGAPEAMAMAASQIGIQIEELAGLVAQTPERPSLAAWVTALREWASLSERKFRLLAEAPRDPRRAGSLLPELAEILRAERRAIACAGAEKAAGHEMMRIASLRDSLRLAAGAEKAVGTRWREAPTVQELGRAPAGPVWVIGIVGAIATFGLIVWSAEVSDRIERLRSQQWEAHRVSEIETEAWRRSLEDLRGQLNSIEARLETVEKARPLRAGSASAAPPTRRLEALESKVAEVGTRLAALEAPRSTNPSAVSAPKPVPADRGLWRALRKGMSRGEVRAALGAPTVEELAPPNSRFTAGIELWYYSEDRVLGPYALFDGDKLTAWVEP